MKRKNAATAAGERRRVSRSIRTSTLAFGNAILLVWLVNEPMRHHACAQQCRIQALLCRLGNVAQLVPNFNPVLVAATACMRGRLALSLWRVTWMLVAGNDSLYNGPRSPKRYNFSLRVLAKRACFALCRHQRSRFFGHFSLPEFATLLRQVILIVTICHLKRIPPRSHSSPRRQAVSCPAAAWPPPPD